MSRPQVNHKDGIEQVSGYAGQVARKPRNEQICDCATEAPVPLLVLQQHFICQGLVTQLSTRMPPAVCNGLADRETLTKVPDSTVHFYGWFG